MIKFYHVKSRSVILFLLMLFLSACGFHLRGINTIPNWLNQLAIISENNDKQFTSMIQSRFESFSVKITPDISRAPYWLIVKEIKLQQQIISIGSSTNPRQYDLTLIVGFVLQTRTGQIIVGPSKINVSRQLTLNNDRILGSKDEENILIGEMKQDAVTQIVYRLSHARYPKLAS
jgi:LPS-assembly lipoprotein